MHNIPQICSVDDVDDLAKFFHEHWSANHVFTRRRDLLDWQHLHANRQHYNFIISRDSDGTVNSMMGFIPSDRYDADLAGTNNTIWQSTWMVLRTDETRGLGKALLKHALDSHEWGWTGTCGLDHGTRQIYDKLGYRTGIIHQYYLLNPALEEFKLAHVSPGTIRGEGKGNAAFILLNRDSYMKTTDGLGLDDSPLVPRKSRQQFFNRYVEHPFYDYQLYLAEHEGHAAIFVTRLAAHNGATALRIVDFLGAPEAMTKSGAALQTLLIKTGAEYLDFYCSGMMDEITTAGLCNLSDAEGLIVPNHFEPFEQHNEVLLYALDGPGDQIVICKGDGDQDRTNLIVAAAGI